VGAVKFILIRQRLEKIEDMSGSLAQGFLLVAEDNGCNSQGAE